MMHLERCGNSHRRDDNVHCRYCPPSPRPCTSRSFSISSSSLGTIGRRQSAIQSRLHHRPYRRCPHSPTSLPSSSSSIVMVVFTNTVTGVPLSLPTSCGSLSALLLYSYVAVIPTLARPSLLLSSKPCNAHEEDSS